MNIGKGEVKSTYITFDSDMECVKGVSKSYGVLKRSNLQKVHSLSFIHSFILVKKLEIGWVPRVCQKSTAHP